MRSAESEGAEEDEVEMDEEEEEELKIENQDKKKKAEVRRIREHKLELLDARPETNDNDERDFYDMFYRFDPSNMGTDSQGISVFVIESRNQGRSLPVQCRY